MELNSFSPAVMTLAHTVGVINGQGIQSCLIIANAVDIMKSVVHYFAFLQQINQDTKINCLIDNSHGAGILDDNFYDALPKAENISYIFSYSLSKAYGISGGAVSCSKEFSGILRKQSEYSGGTSIAPAFVQAFIDTRDIYKLQQAKLQRNNSFFKNSIKGMKEISSDDKLPIFVIDKVEAAALLFEKGIFISSFNYPYPESPSINRIVLNALHTEADLMRLADAIREVF